MNKNILISGVGGQGTVLASRLIAAAAMQNGSFVRTSETIGMAQRGGCVVSHVRIDSENKSPLIPLEAADVLIAFEPAEAARCISRLSADCRCIINTRAVIPVTAALDRTTYNIGAVTDYLKKTLKNAVFIDGLKLAEQAGSAKCVNIVLLGAAIGAGFLDIDFNLMSQVVEQNVPPRFCQLNLAALKLGYNAVQIQKGDDINA
ncbi:MAG TPA: pyruvate ferredoxin oxidoreductase [Ruminococcaceae bacterium]|nr:pyruvate ferredoxin oxidoreductase [Oscillospiraceae bacterium]